ncbi:hypothetical protein BDR07DRAFT_493314 [Suillus spraguei]|nr:hypothetical protein BDR07DRAFT_493314 [Suillus spraguei]
MSTFLYHACAWRPSGVVPSIYTAVAGAMEMPRVSLVHFDDLEVFVVRYYAYEPTSDAKSSGIFSYLNVSCRRCRCVRAFLDKPQAWHTCRTPPSHCVLMHVELARGFLQLHHMAFLQNSIFTLLLHLYWYIKYTWNPNKHCLIDASRRCLALALSRLAGAPGCSK